MNEKGISAAGMIGDEEFRSRRKSVVPVNVQSQHHARIGSN